jgi:hypothetical protein
MPAQGGHAMYQQRARTAAKRQRPTIARAQKRGGASDVAIQRGQQAQTAGEQLMSLEDIHGTRFNPTSQLEQRGHRPNMAPGSYDPRFAAASQRWSAATHATQSLTDLAENPRRRWWQTDDIALAPSTDITYAWGRGEGAAPLYRGTPTDAYRQRMNERWGRGNWETLYTDPGQFMQNNQAGGSSLGAGYF